MSGFDSLLAKGLDQTIRDNLGDKTIEKIEKRLSEKHNVTLLESMNEFHKVDAVLREFFGAGADGLEKKFLEKLCKAKSKSSNLNWFTIEDKAINQEILESYGDDDKNKIINSVITEPKIISDILKHCQLPQTSGYRKINALIEEGLLLKSGEIIAKDGRKISQYRSLFENIKINIIKDKINVEVQFGNKDLSHSTILQVVYNL